MAIPQGFIQSLRPMHPQEVFKAFDTRAWGSTRTTVHLQNEVRPVDLFCYLGARFGPPNGVQNFMRSDGSDNLVHWDWTLRHDRGVIVFLGTNFRTEVHIMGMEPADRQKEDLIDQFKSDFPAHGAEMKKVRSRLEHWVEFVNPYQRLRRAVDRLVEELDELDLRPEEDQFDPFASAAHEDTVRQQWEDVTRRYSRGLGLCFGIRSMLPVMAEAFVNLLLYILMKPEIRDDQRLSGNLFRQPIDVRIRSLSINCLGFKSQPDYSSEVCREYHSLVNQRNDLLHGNVALDKLRFNEVYFLGTIPVFREYRSAWQRSLQIEADAVGLHEIRSELAIIEALRKYLLSCLTDEVRETVDLIVGRHELGLNEKAGRIGVLFPDWLVDMQAGPPAAPDEAV